MTFDRKNSSTIWYIYLIWRFWKQTNNESVYLDVCCKFFCRSRKIKLTNSKFRMQVTRNCSPSTNFPIFVVRQFDDFFATDWVCLLRKDRERSKHWEVRTAPSFPVPQNHPYLSNQWRLISKKKKQMQSVWYWVRFSFLITSVCNGLHKLLLFYDNALFSNCRKTFTPNFDTIMDYLIWRVLSL